MSGGEGRATPRNRGCWQRLTHAARGPGWFEQLGSRPDGGGQGQEMSFCCWRPGAGPPPGRREHCGWQAGRRFVWFLGFGSPGQGRPRGGPWALGGIGQRCPGPDALPDRVRPLGRCETPFPSGGLDRQGLGFWRWMLPITQGTGWALGVGWDRAARLRPIGGP